MVWTVVFITVAVMVVICCFALKCHNQMVDDGKIIERDTNFMESAEEFTLSAIDPAQLTEAIKAINYNEIHTSMHGNSKQQLFNFSGSVWEAKLQKLSDNGMQIRYRFEFTHWKTRNGMAQDPLNMNKLLTSIEKIFLRLDPNTQVRSIPLEFTTRHNIL